ncbi:MAG: acyl carrier protein [Lachnospiraceae bacterium]|nr:acyl carrier protein [Lachnospiraceae bacterium]
MYFDVLKQILEEDFFVADEITPESRFIEDLGLDSLLVMQLLLQMEEKYGVTIDGEEIEGIETIADALKLLEEKIG